VLYLRYDRIGDMVLATGIIRAIVTAQPSVRLDVLASPGNRRVLDGNPHIARVLTFDRRRPWRAGALIRELRRSRYDAVIDAMVMAPSLTTMLLMWASGARHRIGVADRGNEFALTLPVPPATGARNYVDHSAAILNAFGVNVQPPHGGAAVRANPDDVGGWGLWIPEIHLTSDERSAAEAEWDRIAIGAARRRFAVNVSAGAPWRYWADERFVAVLEHVRAAFPDVQALIIGDPHDRDRMQRIGSAAGVPHSVTPSYRAMMALVGTADVVLTADTSVTHIASAFGKASVVLFARSRAGLYGPYGSAPSRVVSTSALALDAIPVAPVVEALDQVLKGGVGGQGSGVRN
jgi:ADP-heptose:LPS heptosyltransferase